MFVKEVIGISCILFKDNDEVIDLMKVQKRTIFTLDDKACGKQETNVFTILQNLLLLFVFS